MREALALHLEEELRLDPLPERRSTVGTVMA